MTNGSSLVQPIRDRELIDKMKNELLKGGYRNYLLFVLGINTGLRISDIITLKVKDVKYDNVTITEKKTKKIKRFVLNEAVRKALDEYTSGMNEDEYLFHSQKGGHISRVQSYRILNEAAKKLGIPEVGTHTCRKTFGYFHYQKYKDVALLQKLFNHSAPSVTLQYIGIEQDMMGQ